MRISDQGQALNTPATPFRVISIDMKELSNQSEKHKWLVIVDEATRLAKAVRMSTVRKDKHRNVETEELLEALDTHWATMFCNHVIASHDTEGAFVSTEIIQEMIKRGVTLPAGIVELTFQTIVETAKRIAAEHEIGIMVAMQEAVAAQHNRARAWLQPGSVGLWL